MILDRTPEPTLHDAISASGLIIWLERHGDDVVVHLEGELDLAGGADLAATMAGLPREACRTVTVDATAVGFIDLSGYRSLVRSTAAGGRASQLRLLAGPTVDRLRQLASGAGCELDPLT